jgi:SAM-dependent methyltransferase
MTAIICRLCGATVTHTFVDLGMSPLCENYLTPEQVDGPEVFYPLHVRVCSQCLLVQLPDYVAGEEIFSHYAYFSSYSDSWVSHAERFVEAMTSRLGLGADSLVTEVASNDGYLLQHAIRRGIPVLGVEPAANVAEVARAQGIRTEVEFLGEETGARLAEQYGKADLVVANNVFAHTPLLLDFANGLRRLVKDAGTVSIEVPHLLRLVTDCEFDTIYHEHYQYFSLKTATEALRRAGLAVFDVEELTTHGGSLRIFAMPSQSAPEPSAVVDAVLADEQAAGLHTLEGHLGFATDVLDRRTDLLDFLVGCYREGLTVAAYGAPGKGNTLLNHCGIRSDLLAFAVDRNPFKHGKFLPGSHIPVYPPDAISERKPDRILILPWNLSEEIREQLAYVEQWGARLVVPIPRLKVL